VHDLTEGTEFAAGSEVACHPNLSQPNFIFRDMIPVAIIDCDGTCPGTRVANFAEFLWAFVHPAVYFSGDKVPPFLAGRRGCEQGLTALLGEPGVLCGQLRAIVLAGRKTRLAVLVPMVRSVDEVTTVRAELAEVAAEAGLDPPELGIMVEVAATAAAATFAPAVDFFSIGTNDLSSQVLGLDRADLGTRPALAADPRVLTLIERVVQAAAAAGVKVSVCGDAAADPLVLPLLLGLGVRTLSVGAARVPQVARWIADTDTRAAAARTGQVLDTALPSRVSR
jgi:phosphoenolpyruvate-protein kinase (PTS system EI component)